MAGPRSYAELRITSRVLTPAQIGYRTGLEEDEVLGKEKQPFAGREVPVHEGENRWALRSNAPEDVPLATHVAELLGRLEPCVDKIKALAEEQAVVFACVIYADSDTDYNQEVFLSGEQVDLICAMGASFWADVYFLRSGCRQDLRGQQSTSIK